MNRTKPHRPSGISPWARAWAATLAELATGPRRLPGRRGIVGRIDSGAGRIAADIAVHGGSHRAAIRAPIFDDTRWDAVVAAVAAVPAHTAALLAGVLPTGLTDPGHTAGLALVPTAAELSFTCSCPIRGTCPHITALADAVTTRLGTHPGTMLNLRGLSIAALAERLRAHRSTPNAPAPNHPSPVTNGNRATAGGDHAHTPRRADPHASEPDPVPEPIWATPAPDPLAGVPENERTPTAEAWRMLIDDAAHRAEQLLRGEDDTAPDALSDAVRWLAAPAGLRHLPTVAASTGKSPVELRRLIVAYRHGGCAAVHAAEHPTDPDPEVLAAAAAAVRRARGGAGGTVVVEGNRLTDPGGRIQIRVGPDDRWHPFTASGPHRDWQSAAGCSPDPAAAYGAALAALRARPQYA